MKYNYHMRYQYLELNTEMAISENDGYFLKMCVQKCDDQHFTYFFYQCACVT